MSESYCSHCVYLCVGVSVKSHLTVSVLKMLSRVGNEGQKFVEFYLKLFHCIWYFLHCTLQFAAFSLRNAYVPAFLSCDLGVGSLSSIYTSLSSVCSVTYASEVHSVMLMMIHVPCMSRDAKTCPLIRKFPYHSPSIT